ncbi:MAG: hypothetical protein ACR2PG_13705 [Hyphomicrobiaceae bacterium]
MSTKKLTRAARAAGFAMVYYDDIAPLDKPLPPREAVRAGPGRGSRRDTNEGESMDDAPVKRQSWSISPRAHQWFEYFAGRPAI